MRNYPKVTVNNPERMDHGRKGEIIRELSGDNVEVWLFATDRKAGLSWIFHRSELVG